MDWWNALSASTQVAAIGAVATVLAGLTTAAIAVCGFWLTMKTSTAANREVIRSTNASKDAEIYMSAALKQAEFRRDWIEELRRSVARFMSDGSYVIQEAGQDTPVETELFKRLAYELSYIELMLNPDEGDSVELLKCLRDYYNAAREVKLGSDLRTARNDLSKIARKVLKSEWNKLRAELKLIS